MRLRNLGESDITVEGVTIGPGEDSEDLPNDVARKLVGLRPTILAFAPESAQSDEALVEADAKPQNSEPEPAVKTPKRRP